MMSKRVVAAFTVTVVATLLGSATPAWADDADVTAPVVTSTGLTDGQLVPQMLNFTPIFSDDVAVTKLQLILDGWIVNTYTVKATWDGRMQVNPGKALHDRDVDLTVRAFDKAGNHGQATVGVHIDTEVPYATITPDSGTKIGGTVTFTVTGASPDLARFSVYDDRANLLTRATGAPFTATWDSRSVNRMFWGQILISDKAGNVDSFSVLLDVDNAAPVVYNVLFPAVDGHLGGLSKTITTYISDYTGVQRVEWWNDGTLLDTSVNPGDVATLHWDTGTANGTANLQIRAYDPFGAVSTLEQTVIIDNRPPALSVTPAEKSLVRTGFTTTAKASDPTGLGDATITIDDGKHGRHTTATTPFKWKIATKLGDGRHTITWNVPDKLGNTATLTRAVTIDNTKPKVEITKGPKNKAKVKGTVKVTVSAKDTYGINKVQLLVNGKVVATDTTAAYVLSVNTAKQKKKMTVQVRGYDKAGNVTYTAKRTWHR